MQFVQVWGIHRLNSGEHLSNLLVACLLLLYSMVSLNTK